MPARLGCRPSKAAPHVEQYLRRAPRLPKTELGEQAAILVVATVGTCADRLAAAIPLAAERAKERALAWFWRARWESVARPELGQLARIFADELRMRRGLKRMHQRDAARDGVQKPRRRREQHARFGPSAEVTTGPGMTSRFNRRRDLIGDQYIGLFERNEGQPLA